MGSLTTQDIILGVFYATGALFLMIAAYRAYLKGFKRAKLEAMNQLEFKTSLENVFSEKTQFLLITPQQKAIKLSLLDRDENFIKEIVNQNFESGEHPVDFDPEGLAKGKYYLYLESEDTNILRQIFIQ
ncbi:MAG: hypothetical protein MI810_16460 [Flavobacteriales bacterium]|nr:hypothetical protein [Flavobacteriales bacterium]